MGLLALAAAAVLLIVLLAGGGSGGRARSTHRHATATTRPAPVRQPPTSFAVGLRVMRLTDPARTIALPDGTTEPRSLLTYVRYPALGSSANADVPNAAPARAFGPFPLVVFGHGFDVLPSLYRSLLVSWARAGYVVVAPVFPRENPEAAGGPDESDLPNQPADMTFLITRMLRTAQEPSSPFSGLIDPAEVAVSGHSDGGDTALAAAYDPRYRDSRIGAAMILSGAEIPGLEPFAFPAGGPPLLATQGTADAVNRPPETEAFFSAARRPKYLLRLLEAEHLPPYTTQQPQLGIVERVTIAFLDGYLKHRSQALTRLRAVGNVPGTATLLAEP